MLTQMVEKTERKKLLFIQKNSNNVNACKLESHILRPQKYP